MISLEADITYEYFRYLAQLDKTRRDGNYVAWLKGDFQRPFRQDIERWIGKESDDYSIDNPVVELNRAGLYDRTPEALWHRSISEKPHSQTGILEMKEDVKKNRTEQINARLFCWAFDNALLEAGVAISYYEFGLMERIRLSSGSKNVLAKFWNLPSGLSQNQVVKLAFLLPRVSHFVGDGELMEFFMSEVLGFEVKTRKTFEGNSDPFTDGSSLGQASLGSTSILGEHLSEVSRVEVFELHLDMKNFQSLINGKLMKLIEWLAAFVTPAETTCKFIPVPKETSSYIGEENNLSALGFNLVLSSKT